MNSTTRTLNRAVGRLEIIGGFGSIELLLIGGALIPPFGMYSILQMPFALCSGIALFGLVIALGLIFNGPHRTIGLMLPRFAYMTVSQRLQEGSKFAPTKLPKILHRRTPPPKDAKPQHKRKLKPFEGESHLIAVVSIDLGDGAVGAYLLRDPSQELYLLFGWSLSGLDPALNYEKAKFYNTNVDEGLQQLPPNGQLKIVYQSSAGELSEIDDLESLAQSVDNPLEQALIRDQMETIRQLDHNGSRQTKRVYAFLQYAVTGSSDSGGLSRTLELVTARFTRKSALDKAQLTQVIQRSYHEGFKVWSGILRENFRQQVQPLPIEQLLGIDYLELHPSLEGLLIPQYLQLDASGLSIQRLATEHHINYFLFRGQLGRPAPPIAMDSILYLPIRKEYVGAIRLGKSISYSDPDGEELGQARFLTRLLDKSGISDYKIVTTFASTPKGVETFLLGRKTREAIKGQDDAQRKGDFNARAEDQAHDAIAARRAVTTGQKIVQFSCLVFIYKRSINEVETAIAKIQTQLGSIVPSERIWSQIFDYWSDTQGWRTPLPLLKPFDLTSKLLTGEASGYVPLMSPQTLDARGVHFLTRTGKAPLHIDLFDSRAHLGIFATTRAGKSVLMADFIMNFVYRKIPVVAFDFPDPKSGRSTYRDMVHLLKRLGGSAEYYDVSKESNNFLEMPDMRGLDFLEDRRLQILDFQRQAIKLLVMGNQTDETLSANVENFIAQSLKAFHDDAEIVQRYEAAIAGGIGSEAHLNTPTLVDYLAYFRGWSERYKADNADAMDADAVTAMAQIIRMLKARLSGGLKRAIATPSTIDQNADLTIFALTNVSDDIVASVYALAGYAALLRKALRSDDCAFVLDESPILFKFPSIPRLVGALCTNGLKWGCRVILSGQNADAIIDSFASKDISTTVQRLVTGWIMDTAAPGLETLGFRSDLLRYYQTASRKPDRLTLMSSWVIKENEHQIEVLYRPSDISLALVANNPDEQTARDRVMARYDDPLAGLAEFSRQYVAALQSGQSLSTIQ